MKLDSIQKHTLLHMIDIPHYHGGFLHSLVSCLCLLDNWFMLLGVYYRVLEYVSGGKFVEHKRSVRVARGESLAHT